MISYEEYYPYGSTSYQAMGQEIKAAAKRYRYTGKERDDETGLYYYGARYYAVWLGRWVSCDPSGLVGGNNLYVYVSNGPTKYNDPTGHQKFHSQNEYDAYQQMSATGQMEFIKWSLNRDYIQRRIQGKATENKPLRLFISKHMQRLLKIENDLRELFPGPLGFISDVGVDLAHLVEGENLAGLKVDRSNVLVNMIKKTFVGGANLYLLGGVAKGGLQVLIGRSSWGRMRSAIGLEASAGSSGAKITTTTQSSKTIYCITGNIDEIWASGRVWGQTEGSVYGSAIPNAPQWITWIDSKVNSPGVVVFEWQASELFTLHPVEGIYSGLKRLMGHQKAGFGDIVFKQSEAIQVGNKIIIRNARLGEHAGQTAAEALNRLNQRQSLDAFVTISFTEIIEK